MPKKLTEHDTLLMHVSEIIREQREKVGMSQNALARITGMHRSYIGDLERGSRNVSVRNLSRLASAMGLQPSKMLSMAEKRMKPKGAHS
jgi:transcriptional regulator with XRE-family HTH domain